MVDEGQEWLAVHFRAGLAQVWMAQGRPEDALPVFQRAVQQAEASMLVRYEAVWLSRLGQCYLLMGEDELGVDTLLRSAKLSNGLRQHDRARWAYRMITSYFENKGDMEAALTYYKMYMEDDAVLMGPSRPMRDAALRAMNQSRQLASSQIPMF